MDPKGTEICRSPICLMSHCHYYCAFKWDGGINTLPQNNCRRIIMGTICRHLFATNTRSRAEIDGTHHSRSQANSQTVYHVIQDVKDKAKQCAPSKPPAAKCSWRWKKNGCYLGDHREEALGKAVARLGGYLSKEGIGTHDLQVRMERDHQRQGSEAVHHEAIASSCFDMRAMLSLRYVRSDAIHA